MPNRAGQPRPPHLHGDRDDIDAENEARAAADERHSARRGFAFGGSGDGGGGGGGGVIGMFVRTYGAYAFSLVSLLAIWYFIVGPTIAANRVDMRDLKQIADQNQRTAEANARTAEALDRTATALNEGLNRLNNIRRTGGGNP